LDFCKWLTYLGMRPYAYAREVMTKNAMAADAQEGMAAFLEKRRACWSGK